MVVLLVLPVRDLIACFSFQTKKEVAFAGYMSSKIGYYLECIPKGLISDCELGKVTY